MSFPTFVQDYADISSSSHWITGIELLFARRPYLSSEEEVILEAALPVIFAEAVGCCNPVWGASYRQWILDRNSRRSYADPTYSFVDDAERNWRAWFRGEAGVD